MHEPGVGRGYRGREDQAGLRHFDLCSSLFRDGRCEGCAVLAPEIQFPGQIHRSQTIVVPALGQRLFRDEVVVALLLFRETRRTGHLRDARGMRALNLSHRRVQPRLGKVEVRGTAQRLLDERIELRIPVGTPPSIPRPRRSRSCEGVRAAELLDLFHGRRRVHTGKRCAAASSRGGWQRAAPSR